MNNPAHRLGNEPKANKAFAAERKKRAPAEKQR